MNVTISTDDDLLARARAAANGRGMSLQQYPRECLRALTGDTSPEEVASELLNLMETQGGHSGGRRVRREEAHEGRAG